MQLEKESYHKPKNRKVHDKINLAVQSEAIVVHIREVGHKGPDQEEETEFPGTTILPWPSYSFLRIRNYKTRGSFALSFIAQLPMKLKLELYSTAQLFWKDWTNFCLLAGNSTPWDLGFPVSLETSTLHVLPQCVALPMDPCSSVMVLVSLCPPVNLMSIVIFSLTSQVPGSLTPGRSSLSEPLNHLSSLCHGHQTIKLIIPK